MIITCSDTNLNLAAFLFHWTVDCSARVYASSFVEGSYPDWPGWRVRLLNVVFGGHRDNSRYTAGYRRRR
eukprot:COSAG04_NODE_809_length_10142_cov_3.378174_18_plen_70_part_00